MSDPLVRIEDEAGHEYQVFKSNFHRLYEELGYRITFFLGDSEGQNDIAPSLPETTTDHIAPPPPVVDTPVSDDVATETAPVAEVPPASPDVAPIETPQ